MIPGQPQMGPQQQPQQQPPGSEMYPPGSQSQPNFARTSQGPSPGSLFHSDTFLQQQQGIPGQPMNTQQLVMSGQPQMSGPMSRPNGMNPGGNPMMNPFNSPGLNPQNPLNSSLCTMITNLVQTTANQIARDAAMGNNGMGAGQMYGGGMMGPPPGLMGPGQMNGLPATADPSCAQNPLFNCIAALINNMSQGQNGSRNESAPGQNMQPCPVPFIIRKVKLPCVKRKPCAAPPTVCCPKPRPRRCCPPDPCADMLGEQMTACPSNCCRNNGRPPILLVQSGRCQTIQVQERCDDPCKKEPKKKVAKKKERKGSRKNSSSSSSESSGSGSSKESGSSGSSGSGSDDDDDDD